MAYEFEENDVEEFDLFNVWGDMSVLGELPVNREQTLVR